MTNRTIVEFVSHLKSLDVQLWVENSSAGALSGDRDIAFDEMRLRCSAPQGTLTTALRQELADRKVELISFLHGERAAGRLRREGFERASAELHSVERGQQAEGREAGEGRKAGEEKAKGDVSLVIGYSSLAEDEGQRTKDEGQRTKDEGQRTKDEGQRTKDEGQRTKDKGQSKIQNLTSPIQTFPLSFAQQRLWFLYQLAPNNPFYNVPAAVRLTGTLDQEALQRSLNEIVRRHATLRTTFAILEGQPVQVIAANVHVELSVVNLQTVGLSDRDRIGQQLATAEAQRPFNLTTDQLLRVTLLQLAPTESVLLLTLHHIIADGWSLGVLIRELASCYTAFLERRSPTLPPLPIQYSDFACWQRDWLQGDVLEQQLAYWHRQLQDLPVLQLPSDRPRPAVQTYRGATYPLQLSPPLTQALAAFSQQSGVSLFMTLLAAFQTLLYRYTGQEDIAIGSPIANRHRSELEGLIGFFVNSLVMRSNLSGNPTFRELLERVRDVALAAYEYQDLPFEKLVEELDPDRDLSRNPLFQVAFALQNAPMQALELPGLTLEPAPLESGSTRFDLEVHLWEPTHGLRSLWRSEDGLGGFISYSTDLFDRDRISRLIGHFQTLLAGIVANPDARLSDLPLLTPAEQQQILVDWNRSPLTPLEKLQCTHKLSRSSPTLLFKEGAEPNTFKVPLFKGDLGGSTPDLGESTSDRCFHHLFEAQVQSAPDAIAVVSEQGSLTYAELNQQANHLALILQQLQVQPDDLVGLCVDRSWDMVIGILGILKAGGAYVPLDPNYPSERLHFMLADTQVTILLTQSWLVESLPRSSAQILCLDQALPSKEACESAPQPWKALAPLTSLVTQLKSFQNPPELGNLGSTVTSDRLAYVIYTSGSTGTPKGVLLSHRGLCNVVEAQQQVFHPSRNSRILQFSSLSFDASIFEIALAFGSGGTLYIPPQSAQLPSMALVQFLEANAITHALLTPAVLAVLPVAKLPALQVLITGGEACSRQVIDRWAAHRHFFNAYGPTETTIWATVAELHPGDSPQVIGRPIWNTQVYILDANLNPVPIGIPGELYIGGTGLARGYLNRPELTAERFISVEFSVLSSELKISSHSNLTTETLKLYQTGDRALYRSDGTIEFLGRVDNQIKLRGFRVELGEIEATLQRHPAIQEAVVMATEGISDDMRLITYFSLDRQYFQQTILQSLQTQQIQYWQTLYNQTYEAQSENPESKIQNPKFNITGWHSSYTGKPIPLAEMQEWVSDRVQQILALKPKRVLEIGCGTGLLLFQIAPHCEQYVATDFSAVTLESLQSQLEMLPQVKLLHRMATDFEDIEAAMFDVVILNSIVQYFPSMDYLLQVLDGAMQTVAPGGVLLLGDIRSLPLLTAFHAWMQFCQANDGMERAQLQQLVHRSQFESPELAIDPAFFYALRDRWSQIEQVQVRLSRGRSQNEMTQFRYNVLLHVKRCSSKQNLGNQDFSIPTRIGRNRGDHYDWQLNPVTPEDIQQHLLKTESEILLITNVANSRVTEAIQVANWIRNQASPKTVGQMRQVLQNSRQLAISPQDWWDLATILPYDVEVNWSAPNDTGSCQRGNYDVVLIRQGSQAKVDWPLSQPLTPSNYSYTNEPLQANFARQLIPELRQHLKQTLPDYMLPSAFVPLAALPLTSNGKLDRRALPTFEQDSSHPISTVEVPSSSTESTLVDIWKELLRLQQVTIHENFFELGGHSLLATQMTSRIRDAFGLELPLKCVFEAPTIAQLAQVLETLRQTTVTSKIPPLVRLDRSAYRRKRSTLSHQTAQIPNDGVAPVPSIADARSPLIPLTLGGNKPPFFCVHPMFGVVFPYLELAQHLGNYLPDPRSFYGLQPSGLDGKSPPLNRIPAIAAYYIQALQTLQPQGPYFLGGWSFGGLVAFEMAQQLTQAGHEIELLAILDTPAPCHKPSVSQSLQFLLGTALWSTLPFLRDYGLLAANRLQVWQSWLSRWQWSAIARLIPEESRLRLLDESAIAPMLRIVYAHAQATYRYEPQPYANRITLFKAMEQSDAIGQDATLGWSTLAADIKLHSVPGNHLSLLKQPHVQILAQQLGQCLS